MDEFNRAKQAVLSVLPKAQVVKQRTDDYPISLSVTAATGAGEVQLWGPGRQQNWFGKNKSQLTQSTADLKAACAKLG